MRKLSLTYGNLPSREVFDLHFAEYVGDTYLMFFGNDERIGTAHISANELWRELRAAVVDWENDNDEKAGAWASSVLSCLGIEWI